MRLLLILLSMMLSTLATFVPASHAALPKANLVLWYVHDGQAEKWPHIQQLFDEWARQNAPGSTLTLLEQYDDPATAFADAAKASHAPDLLWADAPPINSLAGSGLVQSVDPMIDLSLFMPAITSSVRADGKTFGVPMQAGNQLMLFYNKRFVKQAPGTFSELADLGKSLEKQNSGIDGFAALAFNERESLWIMPIAHGFGAAEFSADGKTPALDSDGWVKAYQLLYDLKFVDKIEPQECDYECADLAFKAGSAAMILNGDWALTGEQGYIKALGADLGIAPWPSVGQDSAQNVPAPFMMGQYIAFASQLTGDKLKTAQSFVQFLATDQTAALSWSVPADQLPALLSALHSDTLTQHPILSQTRRVLETSIALPAQPAMSCIFQAINPVLRSLMNDSTKPVDAAKDAQMAAVECIAKLNS